MRIFTTLALVCAAATAQATDMQGLATQLMNNPQVQQAVSQQMAGKAAKTALSNPCGTSTGAGGLASLVAMSQLSGGKTSALAGALNTSEQSALLKFATSPEGQSIMAKLPQLMQQYGPSLAKMYGAK